MKNTTLNTLRWTLPPTCYLCFSSAFADSTAEPESALADISLLQIMMPLLLVIVLIFALAWIVKKMNIGTTNLGQGITVIASAPLSSQARICLVKVGEKDILLGVTNQQISLIHTFNESPVSPTSNENASDFSGHFKKLLHRKNHL